MRSAARRWLDRRETVDSAEVDLSDAAGAGLRFQRSLGRETQGSGGWARATEGVIPLHFLNAARKRLTLR